MMIFILAVSLWVSEAWAQRAADKLGRFIPSCSWRERSEGSLANETAKDRFPAAVRWVNRWTF